MRYVMVPVPSEFVLDVMRWVLFRAPEDDVNTDARDGARLRNLVEDADDLTRDIVRLVAMSTIDDKPVRLTDVAEELGQPADAIRAALRRMNAQALGGGRELVRVSNETGVGPLGKQGKVAFLVMRPHHARLVRTALSAADTTSG